MKLATLASLGLLAAALGLGSAAHAATYYVSDCQAGADPKCVPGDDSESNKGLSPSTPWRTTAKVKSKFGGLAGSDKVLFAGGGVWVDAAMMLQNFNSSAASPITFDSYAPAWGGTARPILKQTDPEETVFSFSDGGEPDADGGYVVQNLDLRGEGTGGSAVFTSQQIRDITLRNPRIEGFEIGVYCGRAIERIKLFDLVLVNNRGQGVLWECASSSIEGNVFDNNGWKLPVYATRSTSTAMAAAPRTTSSATTR